MCSTSKPSGLKRVLGGLVLLSRLALAGGLIYRLLIHAQVRVALIPTVVVVAFIYVGLKWLRGD
jgi:hypothetical protein